MKQPARGFQSHVPSSQMEAAHQGKGNQLLTAFAPQNRAWGSEKDPRLGGAGPFCLELALPQIPMIPTSAPVPDCRAVDHPAWWPLHVPPTVTFGEVGVAQGSGTRPQLLQGLSGGGDCHLPTDVTRRIDLGSPESRP